MTREEAAVDYCLFIGNTSDHILDEYGRKLEFGNQEVFIEAFKKAMEE